MVSRKNQRKKIEFKRIQKRSKRNRKSILDGGEPISIIIRDFDSKRYELKIDTDNTIESIISECRKRSPIDETEFKYVLRLGSIILSDWSKTISDCGIANESTLELSSKKLPSPFCGLYITSDYRIICLYENNTGDMNKYVNVQSPPHHYNDVKWFYDKKYNILKISYTYIHPSDPKPYKYIIYFKPNDCGCDSKIKINVEYEHE